MLDIRAGAMHETKEARERKRDRSSERTGEEGRWTVRWKKTLLIKRRWKIMRVTSRDEKEYSRITPLGFEKMTYCAKGRH